MQAGVTAALFPQKAIQLEDVLALMGPRTVQHLGKLFLGIVRALGPHIGNALEGRHLQGVLHRKIDYRLLKSDRFS